MVLWLCKALIYYTVFTHFVLEFIKGRFSTIFDCKDVYKLIMLIKIKM